MDTLDRAWQTLCTVHSLSTTVTVRGPPTGEGAGRGTVTIEHPSPGCLVFHERGTWYAASGSAHPFRNVYRWQLRRSEGRLVLEHLRHGVADPVALVEFVRRNQHRLVAAAAHVCSPDTYDAALEVRDGAIVLEWQVVGPRKNYRMSTVYHSKGGQVTGRDRKAARSSAATEH